MSPKALAVLLAVAGALGGCGNPDVERGDALARQHRWTEAVEVYERALDRYPYEYDAAWGIARIYCHEVHLADKCLAWTDRLLAAYPRRRAYRRAAAQGWRDRAAEARTTGDAAAAGAAEQRAAELER